MKYMGSKRRIAKDILPLILEGRKPDQWYVEPFVGGGNMIDKVKGLRIGCDINPYVIEALKLIRDSPESLPDTISEDEYSDLKMFKELDGLTGVVGHTCSFGATFFGTYARDSKGSNYMAIGKRSALNQSQNLKGAIFINSSYELLDIPQKSIIYCDPPYKGTAGYKVKFDHDKFWDWCRRKSSEGNSVFVSEYNAPIDFEPIWSSEISIPMNRVANKGRSAVEKLFTYYDL